MLMSASYGLKCLSARFVIDILVEDGDSRQGHNGLKCLSARFVIDIASSILDTVEVEAKSQMPFG